MHVTSPLTAAKKRIESSIIDTNTAQIEHELPRAAVDALAAIIRGIHTEAQSIAGMRKFSFETAINTVPIELAGSKSKLTKCTEAVSKTNALFKDFVSEVQQDITAAVVAEKKAAADAERQAALQRLMLQNVGRSGYQNTNKRPADKDVLCRHFSRGTCNGPDCRFSHDPALLAREQSTQNARRG